MFFQIDTKKEQLRNLLPQKGYLFNAKTNASTLCIKKSCSVVKKLLSKVSHLSVRPLFRSLSKNKANLPSPAPKTNPDRVALAMKAFFPVHG
uniref:Uncharacterized protein n=1 Tax=Romanomermis culicivorax TaxID=13658 RepID=A0A915K312_ROMCU